MLPIGIYSEERRMNLCGHAILRIQSAHHAGSLVGLEFQVVEERQFYKSTEVERNHDGTFSV
jgi:hypothetical protein